MFLDYFPIKYRNFSKMFVPLKIISLGVTNVDFGFTTLDNVSIKILEFSKFKLIEFRKKEFRIAIDSEDDLFEYEIFKNIKNSKFVGELQKDKTATVIYADENGYFSFIPVHKGYWGFAALGAGGEMKHNGKELSQDAVLWIEAK